MLAADLQLNVKFSLLSFVRTHIFTAMFSINISGRPQFVSLRRIHSLQLNAYIFISMFVIDTYSKLQFALKCRDQGSPPQCFFFLRSFRSLLTTDPQFVIKYGDFHRDALYLRIFLSKCLRLIFTANPCFTIKMTDFHCNVLYKFKYCKIYMIFLNKIAKQSSRISF